MTIRVDRRCLRAEDDAEARALLRELQPAWLREQIRLARVLWRLDHRTAFVFEGAASLGEFAARIHFDPRQARELADVGCALEHEARLEALLLAGQVPLASAGLLGTLYRHEEYVLPGEEDEWLRRARLESPRTLRKQVRERIEAVRQGQVVTTLLIAVTDQAREDFARCRGIASARAGRFLSEGETFAVVSRDYVERHAPEEKAPRERRVGPTEQAPQSRYVPASVLRALLERSGGCCEVPGCEATVGLQTVHLRPHRHGSGREVYDTCRMCHRHHVLYDAGRLTFAGWFADGRPGFRGPEGRLLWPPGLDPDEAAPPRGRAGRPPGHATPGPSDAETPPPDDAGDRAG